MKLNVQPGETVMNSLAVYNTSLEPIPVKVYWEDFIYVPPFDGKKNFLPAGSTDYSLNKWMTFSPTEFTLPANSKKKITYSMKVPQDIRGGYYGVLFFENGVPNKQAITGVRIVSRVGCLFFVEAKDKTKKAKINNIKVVHNHVAGSFLNSGNVILIPEGVYYFMSKEETVVDRGEIQKLYLPPQAIGTFTLDLPKKLPEGKYTLVITFDLQDGDSVVKEIDFSLDPLGQIKILQERD